MDLSASSEARFDLGFSRFKTTSDAEKQKILEGRNCSSTNRATKSMIKIINEYIDEKCLKNLDETTNDELPELLENFYSDLTKQNGERYKL